MSEGMPVHASVRQQLLPMHFLSLSVAELASLTAHTLCCNAHTVLLGDRIISVSDLSWISRMRELFYA